MATGNIYRKFGEILIYASGETDKHIADRNTLPTCRERSKMANLSRCFNEKLVSKDSVV